MSPRDLNIDDIAPEYRDEISCQEYGGGSRIEGVQFLPLRQFGDEGGYFIELARLTEEGCIAGLDPDEFKVRQSNFSVLLPGAVKAWHVHYKQEDLWFVPPSERILVGLKDLRKDTASTGQTMRFTMGGGKSQLLLIPRGVAHGCANPWTSNTCMFYFVSQQFSIEDPDERRLAWDAFGAEFWSIHKG